MFSSTYWFGCYIQVGDKQICSTLESSKMVECNLKKSCRYSCKLNLDLSFNLKIIYPQSEACSLLNLSVWYQLQAMQT